MSAEEIIDVTPEPPRALEVRKPQEIDYRRRVKDTIDSITAVRTFVAELMVEGVDFGPIPGTDQKKKNLLLPGAQKSNMYFNVRPKYRVERIELGDGHVEYVVETDLIHRETDVIVGAGVGSCSTMEGKYRYRKAERICPECGEAAIIKGKKEYGGGWLCWKKKGGCDAKFKDGDPVIEEQEVGKIENENIHDIRNTVLKMAKKRSLVDASLGLSCLSEFFTQDMESVETFDLETPAGAGDRPSPPPPSGSSARKSAPASSKKAETPTVNVEEYEEGVEYSLITTFVSLKERTAKNDPKKKWQDFTTEEGLVLPVWSTTQAKIAAKALDDNAAVAVKFVRNGKFLNLADVRRVEE